VYELARERGMDLVTLTDHDTIEGALEISGLPGTFVSEEVTVTLPGGRTIHLGVFFIDEGQHERISALKCDAEALFAYLAEQRIPACLNHLFSALTGNRVTADFPRALSSGLSLIEARNGMMNPRINAFAMAAGREAGLSPVGGSDAHTLKSVATAFTIIPEARNREEFLEGLRRGLTIPAGSHGSYLKLTRDVALCFAAGYRETALATLGRGVSWASFGAALLSVPLLPLLPVVTAAIYAHERFFAERHYLRFRSRAARRGTPIPAWKAGAAAVQS
jgi:hypothetical protein